MATKKTPAAKKTKAPRKPRATKAASEDLLGGTSAPATERQPKDPAAPFPIKLRVETATRAHLAALGVKLGAKPRKVTRVMLKEYLTEQVQAVLDALVGNAKGTHYSGAQQSGADEDDLLG